MHDTFSSSHPLDITWFQFSFVSFKIFMQNASFQDIGDSLESTMRMIRKSSRKLKIKVIQHQKWIEISEMLIPFENERFKQKNSIMF